MDERGSGLLSSRMLQSDNRTAVPLPVSSDFIVSTAGTEERIRLQHFVVGGESYPFATYRVVDGIIIGLDTRATMMVRPVPDSE